MQIFRHEALLRINKRKAVNVNYYSYFFQPHPFSEDIIIIPENEYCKSNRMTVYLGSIYAYKGVLMVSIDHIHVQKRRV